MRTRRVRHASGKVEIIKATFYAIFAVLLAFPIASFGEAVGEFQGIFFNGQLIGVCDTEAEARQAYLDARLRKSQDCGGMVMLDMDVTFDTVTASARDVENEAELAQTIYNKLDSYQISEDKQLAYTVKLKNYTVTLASKEEVVSLLEQAQAAYDTEERFGVALSADEERESNAMTIVVQETVPEESTNEESTDLVTAKSMSDVQVAAMGDTQADTSDAAAGALADNGMAAQASASEQQASSEEQPMSAAQYAETDGIIGMDFDSSIQVSETYVTPDVITDTATALADITAENMEKGTYEVQAGDCLSVIAEKHGMSTKDLLAMNEGMTTDSNILVGDEIVVNVPEVPLSVIVNEQKTYEEEYEAEVQYIDDDTAYAGTNTVIQEGSTGKRIVTAIIKYTDGVETSREIINEEIQKEAVAKIVKRGTKTKPTYIYPVSNFRFTSGFGKRWGRLHKGIDLACSVGTTVHASRGGKVVSAGWNGSYGYSVLIDHGDGVKTRYAHMSKIGCSVGDYVDQGSSIGKSGNTGRSTGPHVHFEIIINGSPVNPLNYL
ncbi:MAG: peptidoglycan DD-metalloendopeptidase family protein [Lachnospiraceae bacterium]|nr:peptidoglycan DD-metalloendopeptidase family protein [Lachnospiraceae bacterium]